MRAEVEKTRACRGFRGCYESSCICVGYPLGSRPPHYGQDACGRLSDWHFIFTHQQLPTSLKARSTGRMGDTTWRMDNAQSRIVMELELQQ